MYTATSIDVFIAAYAGAMGSFNNARVPNSDDPTHYARVSRAALAYAEEFDTIFAVALPNDLQLADIESISGEVIPYPNNNTTAFNPGSYLTVVNAVIAMMSENSAIIAANVTNPIPIPTPTSATVLTIATVIGTGSSLKSTIPTTGVSAIVEGYRVAGDGGGGEFYWDTTSTVTDNIGTVVNPTAHVGPGRWIRVLAHGGTLVNGRWFGARGDFSLSANGQDATAASTLVPWRAFAFIDGTTMIGMDIGIEGAGPAGAIYWGVITGYNTITHDFTVNPAISTTVVDAANLYATDDSAAIEAARDYANQGTNTFYPAGYDLRPAQVYLAFGTFWVPEGLSGTPIGFKLDNATIIGNYEGHSLWEAPVDTLTGPKLFTGGVYRGYHCVLKAWAATFNGLQSNVIWESVKFQDVRYAVANTRCGNFFCSFNFPEFENSGISKGFFAGLYAIEPTATSFGAIGTIFTGAATLGDFTDGSVLVGGTEDGIDCPNAVGCLIDIKGGNLSPLVNTMTGAVDGQAWFILRRLTSLTVSALRLGGESGGMPFVRMEEEADPVNDGSSDASSISISDNCICVSSNLPWAVFDDAAPLRFTVSEDSEMGNFGDIGVPPEFTQTAYNKLSQRITNWVQVALNKVGTVGNNNNATIIKPPQASHASSTLLTLSRFFCALETREYPARNAVISATVYDAVISSTNATITDTTLLGLPAKKVVSTDGVNPALLTLQKYLPDSIVPGPYTVQAPYVFKGSGLTTCQLISWTIAGAVPGPAPIKDTAGQIGSMSYNFYHDGSAVANGHRVQYQITIPIDSYFILGQSCLSPGNYGGQYIPIGGAPIPPFFLHGSTTWDPGNLIPTATETKNVTVTGAVLGDMVVGKSFGLDLQGLTLTADVTAPDVVTAVLVNNTVGAINLDVGTLSIDVYHPPAPFDPGSLTDMVFRVRADQGITLNAGNVQQWDDLSDNHFNLLQATAGSRPLFVASARNGRPCVRGDGVNDILSTAAGANPIGSGAYTLFLVLQGTGLGTTIPFENGTGNLASGLDVIVNAGNNINMAHAGVTDHIDGAASANAEVWAFKNDLAAITLRVNATNQVLTNAANVTLNNPGGTAKISLFESAFPTGPFGGDIYECILYSRALSVTEVAQVEAYLNEQYALY